MAPATRPVERLFEEFRKVLANRVYENLEEVEQVIEQKIQQYWQNPSQLKQLTDWQRFY